MAMEVTYETRVEELLDVQNIKDLVEEYKYTQNGECERINGILNELINNKEKLAPENLRLDNGDSPAIEIINKVCKKIEEIKEDIKEYTRKEIELAKTTYFEESDLLWKALSNKREDINNQIDSKYKKIRENKAYGPYIDGVLVEATQRKINNLYSEIKTLSKEQTVIEKKQEQLNKKDQLTRSIKED